MATKGVEFTFESAAITEFEIRIQRPTNDGFELVTGSSPTTFQMEVGKRFIYMLRVLGSPGDEYKLTITGPAKANSPIKGAILPDVNRDTYLDEFTV